MWGVVKGFHIACNLAGPLGDLTGTGGQSSGRVVHRDLAGPLGDLTGTGDQSSGKVVHRDLAGPLGDLTGTGDQSSGKVVHRDLAGDKSGAGDQLQDKSRIRPARSEQLEKTGVFSSWSNGYR